MADLLYKRLEMIDKDVKDKETELRKTLEELRKEADDACLLAERDRLVDALAHLNARRKDLEDKLPAAAAGLGLGSAAGAGAAAGLGAAGASTSAAADGETNSVEGNPTTRYLEACLEKPEKDTLLRGDAATLRKCLAERVKPGLPVPPDAARRLLGSHPWLQGHLVPDTQQQVGAASAEAPHELSLHVWSVMCDDLRPTSGCSSMYTAFSCHRVLERTWWLIEAHLGASGLCMDRNVTGTSGATASQMRPDFLCWVNGALLLKGEEKADERDMHIAVAELKKKMPEVWAAGTVPPNVPRPSMLAYAAAGSKLQFFCIKTRQ